MSEVERSSSAGIPVRISGGKRKRALLLRHPSLILFALLAAVFAAVTVYATNESRDGIRGPFGAFPAPVATGPPVGPARLLATLQGTVKVTGGLALQEDGGSRLRAINLHTGKVYWEYRRHDDVVVEWEPDGTGSVFVRWQSGRVERVDIRPGKARWHWQLTKGMREGLSSPRLHISATGPVSVSTSTWRNHRLSGWLSFLDRETGRERWRTNSFSNSGCMIGLEPTVQQVLPVADTLVAREECRSVKDPGHLTAFDATGHRRWRLDLRALMPGTDPVADLVDVTKVSDRLLALSRNRRDGYTLVDATAGRVIRQVPSLKGLSDDEREKGSGSIRVSLCSAPHAKPGDDTRPYLCADDPRTDKPLWTVRLPEGFRGAKDEFAFSGGRFYTVLTHTDATDRIDVQDEQQVGVFESRTGRLLGRIPLPREALVPRVADKVSEVTDGIVSVAYHSGEWSYVKLFAA